MQNEAGITISNLKAWHNSDAGRVEVCNRVDVQLGTGKILGLMGPNGSGKTTLLRSISGIHAMSQSSSPNREQIKSLGFISLISQNYRASFFPWLSLKSNILAPTRRPLIERKASTRRLDSLLEEFQIDIDLNIAPSQASGGMLQQANVLRALITNPQWLLADEPLAALDIEISSKIKKALRRHIQNNNMSAIFVLHDPTDILELCDEAFIIPGKPFSSSSGDPDYHLITHIPEISDRLKGEDATHSAKETFTETIVKIIAPTVSA